MSDETAVFNVLSDENYATDLCLGEFSKNTLKESSSDVTSLGYTKHILRFAESFSNAEGLVGSSPIKLGQKNLGRYAYDILRSSHIRNNKINESSLRQNEFIY